MNVPILGIGSVSALGCGVDSLVAGLRGTVAPRRESTSVVLPTGTVELPVYVAEVDGLDHFAPRRSVRRLDRFTRMALLASFLAVEDSGVAIEDKKRVGLVFGTGHGPLNTTFGFQDTIIDDGDAGASPTLFANSVHNALASAVSIRLSIEGPCLTLADPFGATTEVLRTARAWLAAGTVDYVLAGVGDELCSTMTYVLCRMGVGQSDRIVPLDFKSCTFLPGEGFVTFLLGREAVPARYGCLVGIDCERPDCVQQMSTAGFRSVFLAANGDRRAGPCYGLFDGGDVRMTAYSPLYGSMSAGHGLDVALAGVSSSLGCVYPSPGSMAKPMPLRPGERIGCVECSATRVALISLARL